jgi:hypothetical protein
MLTRFWEWVGERVFGGRAWPWVFVTWFCMGGILLAMWGAVWGLSLLGPGYVCQPPARGYYTTSQGCRGGPLPSARQIELIDQAGGETRPKPR